MYVAGDKVEYRTITVRTQNGEIVGQTKTGIIEEAFCTLDKKPCYWVVGEKELILGNQIIKRISTFPTGTEGDLNERSISWKSH